MVHDPKCNFVGVILNGRVVALGNLRLVDGGRTGWLEGLRVHQDFRGRGFANEITQFLVNEGEQLGVQRLRYTTGSDNLGSLKDGEKTGFSKVMKLPLLWAFGLKNPPSSTVYYEIEEIDSRKTYELLRNNSDLISDGLLVYDWKVLDFNRENMEVIGKDHRFFAGSTDNGSSVAVSFGRFRPDFKNQPWWACSVYASDSKGFKAHVTHNVKVALDQGLSSIMMIFQNRFEKIVSKLDLEAARREVAHLFMLEKKL